MTLHPDQPDYSVPSLGPISKESRLSWHSQLSNNGATPSWRKVTGDYREGKFFPRGCRGFITTIEVYCRNTTGFADEIHVCICPQPGMGPTYHAIIPLAGVAAAAWRPAIFHKMWNYDSLFVFVKTLNDNAEYGYDEESPRDFYTWVPNCGDYDNREDCENAGCEWEVTAIVEGVSVGVCHCVWNFGNHRLWILVNFQGETAGDVPVSGTINNIEIPSRSDTRLYHAEVLDTDAETIMANIDGAGETVYLNFDVGATIDSQLLIMRVYCDGNLAFEWNFATLNADGYAPSTPGISLLSYAVDGGCVVHLMLKFSFRRNLRLTVQREGDGVATIVSVEGLVNLLK